MEWNECPVYGTMAYRRPRPEAEVRPAAITSGEDWKRSSELASIYQQDRFRERSNRRNDERRHFAYDGGEMYGINSEKPAIPALQERCS